MGMITIDHKQLAELHNAKVLLREHMANHQALIRLQKKITLTLIDASVSCSVKTSVAHKKAYDTSIDNDTQIVIYGHHGHAEINGLVGQTEGKAIVIEDESELNRVDFSKNIRLFLKPPNLLMDLIIWWILFWNH